MVLHRITGAGLLKSLERVERSYLMYGVAATLAEHRGRVHSTSEIIDSIYSGFNTPADVQIVLKVAVCRLRKRGFQIQTHFGRGYSHGTYA